MKRLTYYFAAATLLCTASAYAGAPSPGLVATSLTPGERAQLQREIVQARGSNPAIFERVRNLTGLRSEVWQRSRARRPEVTRELRRLGAPALLPMLEVMAITGYPAQLSSAERLALEEGLLQASAELRDARAEPVFRAAFQDNQEIHILMGAVRGLGSLGSAESLNLLLTASRSAGAKHTAAIHGLGWCHNMRASQRLGEILQENNEKDTVLAAQAMATAGSSWAWSTGRLGDARKGDELRAFIAQQIVTALANSDRLPVGDAAAVLAMVESPNTRAVINDARLRNPNEASRGRLEQLAAKLNKLSAHP